MWLSETKGAILLQHREVQTKENRQKIQSWINKGRVGESRGGRRESE